MWESIDDITLEQEEDGELICEILDRVVLSKGAWSTILFKIREMDKRKGEMGPVKFTIRRYRKMKGVYRQQSKFNISSVAQATKRIEGLQKWVDQEAV